MSSLSADQRRAIRFAARSVYERVAAFDPVAASAAADLAISPEAAAALQSWNQVFSPGDREAFGRRLEWDGLDWTVTALALSAAEGSDQLQDPLQDHPERDWTIWLDLVLDVAAELAGELDAGPPLEAAYFTEDDEPPFIELAIPALRAARGFLLRINPDAYGRLSEQPHRALERQLLKEVAIFGERTFHELFRRTIAADAAPPADSASEGGDARYRAFVRSMLDGGLAAFFVAYPVLARTIEQLMETWVESTNELTRRLEADRDEITSVLAGGVNPGFVVELSPALSDPHNGRRRVAALTFDSGLRVIYKPRDVGIEKTLSDFLEWCNARGCQPPQRALRVIERRGYGWIEFAEHETFDDVESVRRYFERAGGMAAVAHLLGATDLHMENVVATRGGPVIVDPESLLHPGRISVQESDPRAEPTPDTDRPCVATGFVTFAETGADGSRYETGGLRGTGLRGSARARRAWKQLRTDALHYKDEHEFQAPTANRVMLNGVVQRAEDFREELRAGFASTYRFFAGAKHEVVAAGGPLDGFIGRRARVMFRQTNQYAVVQDVVAAPRYQTSGVARSTALDVLARPFALDRMRPVAWPLAVREREALDGLDIPHFTVGTDETIVRSHDRVVGDRFFTRAGLDIARERLLRLSEPALTLQLNWLDRSLSESATSHMRAEAPRVPAPTADAEVRARRHIAIARWIGEELIARAVTAGDSLTWKVRPPSETPKDTGEHDLYDGSLGPALFLAALSHVTGEPAWADAARRAVLPATAFASREDLSAVASRSLLGVGNGLGSVVYGLLWVGKLLGDDKSIDAAVRVANLIDDARIGADRDLDVLAGSAGAILALLALHHERGGRFLETASACGDHLLATQIHTHGGSNWPSRDRRLLAGFAHGAAGMSYALIRLFEATGKRAYLDAALRGHQYERAIYSPVHRNWPLVRSAGHLPGNIAVQMTAWCHGAPGIALARSLVRNAIIGEDPDVANEIDIALNTTAGFPGNPGDHLCCGNVGRCEVLFTAGLELEQQSATDAAFALADRVVERALRWKRFQFVSAGYEYVVFAPGFFHGLSGIGYQLLRLAAPSRLPSILAFEGRVTAGSAVAGVGTGMSA